MPVNPNQATDFAGTRVGRVAWTAAITGCVRAVVGPPSEATADCEPASIVTYRDDACVRCQPPEEWPSDDHARDLGWLCE